MAIPCINFNVDLIQCFSELWKSCLQPETEIQKMKKEMEKLKAKRNDMKNKIEEARRDNRLESEEARQWQRYLDSMEHEVSAIFEDFTRINFRGNIKLGPWGVPALGSDTNFDTGPCMSQITRLTVYYKTVVNSLEVSYVVDQKNDKTSRLGAEGGHPYKPFKLDNDEYINTILGFIDHDYEGNNCISQLQFNTNLGNTTGPLGKGGGKEFTVRFDNGQIVGFFGYYGKYLKAIGVYVAPIN